jgi:hypothetical protein
MSNNIEAKQKRHLTTREKAIRATGAFAAAAAFFGAGIATYAEFSKPSPKPPAATANMKQVPNKALESAMAENAASTAASESAATFTETLNGNDLVVGMQVLNGEVEIQDNTGGWTPYIKDPIWLSKTSTNAKSVEDGSFLNGGFMGEWTVGAQGNDIIMSIKYDSSTMRFIAFDTNNIVISNLAVRSTKLMDSLDSNQTTLVAYDAGTNSIIYNSDGSVLSPGFSLGQ